MLILPGDAVGWDVSDLQRRFPRRYLVMKRSALSASVRSSWLTNSNCSSIRTRDTSAVLFCDICCLLKEVMTPKQTAQRRETAARLINKRVRPPVWPGGVLKPFFPLWLPLPCSQKRRASVLLAQTYQHNKSPTARAWGDSLASSRRTNSRLGQILHSCIIRWRWSSKFSNSSPD
jgi:hypothetical protein